MLDSFATLSTSADLILVEGAGSPAEINLRPDDIANMGFARAAHVPVILAGDIERGGVIAQLVGTHALLDPADAALVKGFLVNKFRGDPSLFDDGYRLIAERTGWPGFGVVPWFPAAARLPAEDAADLAASRTPGPLRIACPILSRIANFDDLDPLKLEPSVSLQMIPPGHPLPGDSDLVILPGTKSTRGDLAYLRAQGWDIDLLAHARRGGRVLGLCGGYQMLGRSIADPLGLEGPPGTDPGLGLLDVETVMEPDKRTEPVTARHLATGEPVTGYEIHLGRTAGPDCARPVLEIAGQPDGATSADGRIAGTYVHGLFAADPFRRAYLAALGAPASPLAYAAAVDATLDALAAHLETHLDLSALLDVAARRTDF